MKVLRLTAAAAALVLGTGVAMAGGLSTNDSVGANANAPGTQMHTKGSVKGTTGASGYSPGHQMRTTGSASGSTGASGYAPGHNKMNTDSKAGAKIR